MKLNKAPKASHELWFESSCSFWTPRGATMTLEKGCRTDYSVIFGDINEFFVRFYITFRMPLCCLEFKFSYLRTCKSHSIANTCWHRFHVRPHLVNAQQVIVLRAAVDFFYQEAKAQKSPMNSTSRSRYMPTRYNSQVQLIHNIAITCISTLWNWRAHLKQSEIWRKTVDKKNKTQKTPCRTRTYTNAHSHHVDAHSVLRCLRCPLSNQWCERIV